jgi:arginyl-tRNA synthetase
LAKTLRQNPRSIAQQLASDFPAPTWIREIRVEGAGYLNFFLDRNRLAADLIELPLTTHDRPNLGKTIIEHTNINPNKAAHIGHLRNAVLGDILARLYRSIGHQVEVQNYIDDTGVQLADVVVGLLDLRELSINAIEALPEPFDFYCWDLYSEVGRWLEQDPSRQALRRKTLHELEQGRGERAAVGQLVAKRIVHCHLGTMRRIGVPYDLLTHESAVLGLDFFYTAFERLKEANAIRKEETGKNQGCWVMPLSTSEEFAGLEDPDKVIVRSDGTVTYVGKDIAYQLWKFGLLGLDFGYQFWEDEQIWETTRDGAAQAPAFGSADRVINVIDARQSYLQKIVRVGLESLGHHHQAENSIHFAYEMVALSPQTAIQLGFISEGDSGSASLEMSGRKGVGVKADDLLDQLEIKSRKEIQQRSREIVGDDLDKLAREIATAALRFFMVKSTTTRVIAFDLGEALSFDGESGPYLQYSYVRAQNILRRLSEAGLESSVDKELLDLLRNQAWPDDLWDLLLTVAQIENKVAAAERTLELSLIARHALDLAQQFNAIYHRHPILREEQQELRAMRLAAVQVFCRGMELLAGLMGIPLPARM